MRMYKSIINIALVSALAVGVAKAQTTDFLMPDDAENYSYNFRDHEVHCMAMNMYWEARNQPVKGMLAVGLVTMNRVADKRYPDTVCAVVTQGPTRPSWKNPAVRYPIRNRCQFSWYCDGKSDKVPKVDMDIYDIARMYAYKIYYGHGTSMVQDFTNGATHYHADYVTPAWAETKKRVLKIGRHIFYKWIN